MKNGLAVDIGTTTVTAVLVDLSTGKKTASFQARNNQRKHGSDVISRISYSLKKKANLLELQTLVIKNINDFLTQIDSHTIQSAVVAGNTVMEHLFLAKNTKPLASLPFSPSFKGGTYIKAAKLGININPKAEIYVLPNLAGFIGGDITAGILATGLYSKDSGYYLLIDIGTNGEVVIGNKKHIYCASAAAGPAFETMGIPGSKVIDLMATLLKEKIIDRSGKLFSCENPAEMDSRFRGNDQMCRKDRSLPITQKNVRRIQLAKSAIFTAITLLMQEVNISKEKIKKIYIAGNFGKNINITNAINIGLIPKFPLSKIKYLGNTSLQGAQQILLNKDLIKITEALPGQCQHVELANKKQFQDVFVENLFFPQFSDTSQK